MVLIQSSPLPKIVFTSLFVCVYRVFGENAICYNSDSLYVGNCAPVRKWWNWQTDHLSLGVARTPNEVASAASASAGRGGLPLLCVFMSKDWRSEVDCVSSWTSIRICKDH